MLPTRLRGLVLLCLAALSAGYAARRAHAPRGAVARLCAPARAAFVGSALDDAPGVSAERADSFDLALAERIASGEQSDDDFDADGWGEYVVEPLDDGAEPADPNAYTPSERGASRHEEWDTSRLPLVAVVGRPNVGKSMIVNRLSRQFQGGSITYDAPGITRDRSYRTAYWNDKEFRVRAALHRARARACSRPRALAARARSRRARARRLNAGCDGAGGRHWRDCLP